MRRGMLAVLVCFSTFGCGRTHAEPPAYAESEAPSEGSELVPPRAPSSAQASQPEARATPAVLVRSAEPAVSAAIAINGEPLSEPLLRQLEARLGAMPEPGGYWYDERSGLWGLYGHGASGVTKPGLHAPPLPSDASAGTTHVLVNGRELTPTELHVLASLLDWSEPDSGRYGGRYVLDASGELFGPGNRYLGNVATAAEKQRAAQAASAHDCAWPRFGGELGVLGRNVSVACD